MHSAQVRSSGASLAHAPMELKADKDLVIEDELADCCSSAIDARI